MNQDLIDRLKPPFILELHPGGTRLCVAMVLMETDTGVFVWAEDGWIYDSALNPHHITVLELDKRIDIEGGIVACEGGCIRELRDDERPFWDDYVKECEKYGGLKKVTREQEDVLWTIFGDPTKWW